MTASPIPPQFRFAARPALVLALALAGCANPQADQAILAQSALVGMPKQTLLSCAGVPDRSAVLDGAEYFTYNRRSASGGGGGLSPSVGIGGSTGGSGVGLGVGVGFPLFGGGSDPGCAATFTLRGGVVRQLTYGSGSAGACYPLVQNCLALAPPPPRPLIRGAPPATPPASTSGARPE